MPPLKVISFRVEDRCFALPSRQVKEIIDSEQAVKPLFYGGELLKGLISYGGDLISVLNLPLLLDVSGLVKCPAALVCKDKESGTAIALTVSEVLGIERVGAGRLEPVSGKDAEYIKGFIKASAGSKGSVVALMDLDKIARMGLARIKEDNGSREYGGK